MGLFGRKGLGAAVGIAVGMVVLAGPARAEPGERWQTHTAMSMAGMTMPGQENVACVPKNATAEDMPSGVPDENNCKISNLKTTGNTTRYDIACTGDQPMKGTVETTTQGRDAYTSVMTMTMDGQTMTMKTTARKLGGDCDAGAVRRQMQAVQTQSNNQLDQACADGAERMEISLFDGTLPTIQCSAKDKARFCEKAKTRDGYAAFANGHGGPGGLEKAAALCGTDVGSMRANLCRTALDSQDAEFLRSTCPAEAQVLAQRVCTGRSYTSVDMRFRPLCVDSMRGAAGGSMGGSQGMSSGTSASSSAMDRAADRAADKATDAATDAVIDGGSRLIRGLFGN